MQKLDNYEQELKHWGKHEEAAARLLGEYLHRTYSPKRVVDIGCGSGIFLTPFAERGSVILGVDGEKTGGAAIAKKQFKQADLRKPHKLGKFNLAICLEVIEHLQPEYADVLLDNIVATSPLILFSGAKPDQVGTNHYNCQPKGHWIKAFQARGYELLADDTDRLIEFVQAHEEFLKCPWLEENMFMVGRK